MTAEEIKAPRDDTDWEEDRARLAATEVFVLAVIGGYVPKSVWSLVAANLKLEAIAKSALAEARHTRRLADEALSKLSGLHALVRSLERRIDDLTPGVQQPQGAKK